MYWETSFIVIWTRKFIKKKKKKKGDALELNNSF